MYGKMVDVTRSNFAEVFQQIKKEIEQCVFVAIDAEFTGLLNGQDRDSLYDTPAERYTRHRDLGGDFIINQFGLCLVEETPEGAFTARPYNFYLYPVERSNIPQRDDAWFCCQASSLKLLSQSGFDFNKWIRDGIQYVSESRERQKQQQQAAGWKIPVAPPSGSNSETPSPQSVAKRLRGMARGAEQESFVDQVRRDLLTFTHNTDARELKVKTHSRFERKVVYTLIEEDPVINRTPLAAEKAVNEGRDVELLLRKITQDAQKVNAREKADKLKIREELKLGFTTVIQLLSDSRKPMVVHNGLLDLMNLFRQFFGPLPEGFDQFKREVLARFPHLMDTKLLASSPPFSLSRTRLEDIFSSLVNSSSTPLERVEVQLPEGYSRYSDDKKAHEAGYDAYMTAVCFAHMFHHLRKLARGRRGGGGGEDTDGPVDAMGPVAPFRNRIAMGFCDVQYIDFRGGPDPLPPRHNVFRLTVPPALRTPGIVDLFAPFGPVDVRWVDDCHAFVSLRPEKSWQGCLKYVRSQGTSLDIQVQTYREYRPDLYDTPSPSNSTDNQSTTSSSASSTSALTLTSSSSTSTSTSSTSSSSTSTSSTTSTPLSAMAAQRSTVNGRERKRLASCETAAEASSKRWDVGELSENPVGDPQDDCSLAGKTDSKTNTLFSEPSEW